MDKEIEEQNNGKNVNINVEVSVGTFMNRIFEIIDETKKKTAIDILTTFYAEYGDIMFSDKWAKKVAIAYKLRLEFIANTVLFT